VCVRVCVCIHVCVIDIDIVIENTYIYKLRRELETSIAAEKRRQARIDYY